MKIIILAFFLMGDLWAEGNCSSQKSKVLGWVNKANNFGYYSKKKYLKEGRKLALGSTQICDLSDSSAKVHKVKCQLTKFGIKEENQQFCVCSAIEVIDKINVFKPSCLTLDKIHD